MEIANNPLEVQNLKQLSQNLPITQKIKPILNSSYKWNCKAPSDFARILKCKPKTHSSVSVNALRFEIIKSFSLKNLLRALFDTKTTHQAALQISNLNAKQLSQITNFTNCWKNLKFITFPAELLSLSPNIFQGLSRLRRCKNLSHDPLPISPPQLQISKKLTDRVCSQLKGLNKLQHLSVEIPQNGDPEILFNRPSRSLKSITLYFENKERIEHHQHHLAKFLSKIQKRCIHLESLALKFYSQFLIEPSDAQIWNSFFQNSLKNLKKLDIQITIHDQQQPEGFQAFIESFKHLKNLTAFSFILVNSRLRNHPLTASTASLDAIYSSFFTSLQSMTKLEELKLQLKSFNVIKKASWQHFASMLDCLNNLRNLSVKLPAFEQPQIKLSDLSQYFSTFASGFKDLAKLKILDLEFSNNANQKSLEILSKGLAHLPLTSLSLDIGHSTWSFLPDMSKIKSGLGKLFGISTVDPEAFLFDVSEFSQLSELKIDVFIIDIPKINFTNLALQLKTLKNFTSLTLGLCLFPPNGMENNYQGLQNLFSCFKDFPKLTCLKLHFLSNIGDEDVRALASNIVECKELKELNVHAEGAKLTDQCLHFLLEGLRNLKTLEILTLQLKRETAFGNNALLDLLEGLVVLENLKEFVFVVNQRYRARCQYRSLPGDLHGYLKLKDLTSFIVYDSRYI